MALYKIYSVVNEKDIFTKISSEKKIIKHPTIGHFSIINTSEYIYCECVDSVEMPFSSRETKIFGNIEINILFARYKSPYCIVALYGAGLFAIGSKIKRYINESLLGFLKIYINKEYNIDLEIQSLFYENKYFGDEFWGDNITSKLGYNSFSKMYIKLSSADLNKILKANPILEDYFSGGSIKSIRGKMPDLIYTKDDKNYSGDFKFQRDGLFKCEFFDIIFFNMFLRKLIDRGFKVKNVG